MFYNFSESAVLIMGDQVSCSWKLYACVALIYEDDAIRTSKHVARMTNNRNACSDFSWKTKKGTENMEGFSVDDKITLTLMVKTEKRGLDSSSLG
jgi:hypothetical protein